ncbi:MAG: CHASE2 domain-containing protein [Enhygromyxa sp.]
MGKARIETSSEDRATSPRELVALLRASLTILVALLVVLVLDSLGAVAAIDEGLRRRHLELGEALGVSRESSELIVVVAADRDTIAAWGPPPWPAERLAQLVEQIELGDPDLIAELGHTRLFTSSAALDQIVESRRAELLLHSVDDDLRSPWSGVGLERGELVLGPNSRLVELGARSDRLPPVPERLPVHWLTPASRLPVVPAHQVARGKIPTRTFARRVVVLGLTDLDHVMPVATPIGLLSPVEVEAHALTGLADGVVWLDVPAPWAYLCCASLAAALLCSLERLRAASAAAALLGAAALWLALDFALYERGLLRLGSGHALLTIGAIAASHWLSEVVAGVLEIRRLRVRVLRESVRVGDPGHEIEDLGYWDDLAALGAEYAQERLGEAAGSTVLERDLEGFDLEVRASAKLDRPSHEFIAAHPRLDLRRAPFRAAWLTLRASWTTELLPRGPLLRERRTLIVPVEQHGELLAIWLLHTEQRAVEPEEIATFERLGRQMAGALARRRERVVLRDQSRRARLRDQIETIVGGLEMLRDEHRWALELLEQLPVRAMIATVWGELEFVDPRLRSELARRYPGLFGADMPEQNLRAVLARLTGTSFEDAHRLMRNVVGNGVEIELDAVPGIDDPGDEIWVLSRIQSHRGIDLPGFKPALHEHILLTAHSSAPAQTIKTRSGAYLRVLGKS